MRHRLYPGPPQRPNHRLTVTTGRQDQVVHVSIVLAVVRHDGATQSTIGLGSLERFVISIPDRHARLRDGVCALELSHEQGGHELAGQVRRTDLLPGVAIDLTAQKSAAIGALLANHLGPRAKRIVIDQQCPTLACHDILGFVKADSAEIAHGTERTAAIRRHHALGSVLDHAQAMPSRYRHDRIHFA